MMWSGERVARLTVVLVAVALPLAAVLAGGLFRGSGVIELRARMPEAGGWQPGGLAVQAGEPLRLRLTSDDVMHGFAIGKLGLEPIDVKPGEVTVLTLSFAEPGRYVYYCTRWCGPDHWRMRGTIEVTGVGEGRAGPSPSDPLPAGESIREAARDRRPGDDALAAGGPGGRPGGSSSPPLFMELGIDLDAPHPARHVPAERPSAERGESLGVPLPAAYLSPDTYLGRRPDEVWAALRVDPLTRGLSDMQVWDLLAWLWAGNATSETLTEGERLYRANCAACHAEGGAGDGVMARSLAASPKEALPAGSEMADSMAAFGHATAAPADFTDPHTMLGASSALLEGKIIRGGMGTGMPYWGPIFTEPQIRALVSYLWSFQFDADGGDSPSRNSPQGR